VAAYPADLVTLGLLGLVEVPSHLAVHPEPTRGAEVLRKPEGGAWCDPAASIHDHIYPLVGHTVHHKGFCSTTAAGLLTFGSHSSVPKVSAEQMSREVGGLDRACLVEQVAGVVEKSEMPTVDAVPVLLTG
jgi:hypothetical protein